MTAVAALALAMTPAAPASRKPAGQRHVPASAPADSAWYWFATCHGPAMTLEVRLDSASVYQSTFPLCRGDSASGASQGQDARIAFWFEPRRSIIWQGYKDADDTTRPRRRIEGDIWEAGADTDDLLLGVSFSTSGRILMHTTHPAHPTRADSTYIAKGLIVLTYPARTPK
jgi:hypothetical protein